MKVSSTAAKMDADQRIPIREGRAQIVGIAAIRPRFTRPAVALDIGDEIQQPPASDKVSHQVLAGTHPNLRGHFEIEVAQPLRRHQAAIGHAAGKLRLFRPKQKMAHGGMNAIGADQHIGGDADAVFELRLDPVAVIGEAGQAMAEMQALRGQRGGQHRQHIRAMALVVRIAECRHDLVAERRAQQRAAVLPSPLVPCLRTHAVPGQFISQSQPVQDARGVRADLNAGADFAQMT